MQLWHQIASVIDTIADVTSIAATIAALTTNRRSRKISPNDQDQ